MSILKLIRRNADSQQIKTSDLSDFHSIFSEISHDLKGNLIAIKASAGNINRSVNLTLENMDKSNIEKSLLAIDKKINHTMILLNMCMLFSNPDSNYPDGISEHSMRDTILASINTYPFASEKHAAWIEIQFYSEDFLYTGNKSLILGVFYCLIKNAMRSIYNLGSGKAIIYFEKNTNENKVHFKFIHSSKANTKNEQDIFALGTPEKPENGLLFIMNAIKNMNGDIEFKQEDEWLHITLIFPLES